MNGANILKVIENLDHDQRWKYMIALGKKAKNYPALSQSLATLADSNIHYHRVIALMSAHGSYEPAMIARALEDASNVYLSSAITLAAQHLDADRITDLVPGLSKKRRHLMFMALLRVRRTIELADKYGWSKSLRDQLQCYRTDKSLWISDAAELVIPPLALPEADSVN
ncbi:hypothetical protein [Limnobaculum parvum]|uniref:HEAT repeat domain-containing protein n=1 Tax=Limnobaculum parvum TaxID=2172103 RepID=A0A2Y9TW24_9GAMM|nr:hypothetical protein [Limnobaculum parvum]AWH87771.1 hypothetical protein HYN51_03860 [Limnobaculum parvum]